MAGQRKPLVLLPLFSSAKSVRMFPLNCTGVLLQWKQRTVLRKKGKDLLDHRDGIIGML